MTVVLPFCNRDAACMIDMLRWCADIDSNERCLVSYDTSTTSANVNAVMGIARRAYKNVEELRYSTPKPGHFPPNKAFYEAAQWAQKNKTAWFWNEADCIPLRNGWLRSLKSEYLKRGKPFMGYIVPDLGHMNGVAIYPADAATRMIRTMNEHADAFDVVAKEESVPFAHAANALMYHAWTIQPDGKLHPYAGGNYPTFTNRETLRQIPPSAVLFHRCKDGSLTRMLRQCKSEI